MCPHLPRHQVYSTDYLCHSTEDTRVQRIKIAAHNFIVNVKNY